MQCEESSATTFVAVTNVNSVTLSEALKKELL